MGSSTNFIENCLKNLDQTLIHHYNDFENILTMKPWSDWKLGNLTIESPWKTFDKTP